MNLEQDAYENVYGNNFILNECALTLERSARREGFDSIFDPGKKKEN